jgi:hypothetical protein
MIFQLSEEPIKKEDFLQEEILYGSFVGKIADYISSDVNRDEEIESFVKNELEPYGVFYDPIEQSIIFAKNFKRKFFEQQYQKFKEYASKISMKVFAGYENSFYSYQLQAAINREFATYIFIYSSYMTLDEFIREMTEGQKYYFGAAMDYHF